MGSQTDTFQSVFGCTKTETLYIKRGMLAKQDSRSCLQKLVVLSRENQRRVTPKFKEGTDCSLCVWFLLRAVLRDNLKYKHHELLFNC